MGKRHINFGSISQFREIIKNVQHTAQYLRYDEKTKLPVMDRSARMPTIKAVATEKIHGTNGGVSFCNPHGLWVQSRENIITPEQDNAGCAFAVMKNQEQWMNIIRGLSIEHEIDLNTHIISVFFEWCGGNIQAKSAVTGMDKRAIIFRHFKVSPIEEQTDDQGKEMYAKWYETCLPNVVDKDGEPVWLQFPESNIFHVMKFPKWTFEINFETPLLSQNEMIRVVEEIIEPSSPLGKEMGIEGNIGEGMVVEFLYKDSLHRFKVKGEKHAGSRVKTLKPVDDVKEQAKIDFATYACAPFRLEQAYDLVSDRINGGSANVSMTGAFLKAVVADVMKEELDVMTEKGLEPKEVNGKISDIARRWFMEQLDKDATLS